MRSLTIFGLMLISVALSSPIQGDDTAPTLPLGTRAAFEYSPKCIRGYLPTSPTWTRYVDVYFDNQVRRVFVDQSERWTCYDNDMQQHEAYRIPGKMTPPEVDTYVIFDMYPSQVPIRADLTFLAPGAVERNFEVYFLAGQRGQMILYDPQ